MSSVVLKNLVKSYDNKKNVIDNISLEIKDKEFVVLVGSSGCGKSTLLKSLNRMNDLVEGCKITGQVTLDGVDIYKDMDVNFAIHGDGVLYTPKEDELIKILSKGDQLPYEVIDFDEYLKEDRLKLLIVCKPETMPAVIERAKTFKDERFKCASLQTTQHLFEFMDPRISKSFGLQKLMEMHGLTMENLCTFGDADNDYDMTLHAGVGVVMANGSEKTKSVADHITKDNDHDGIGVFLQEHLISRS